MDGPTQIDLINNYEEVAQYNAANAALNQLTQSSYQDERLIAMLAAHVHQSFSAF